MAYTVFARKYRPQTFQELVGQEHVARTLAGAIETDRVAHAFLFTGVRGVGKTTTARLLAKALCCEKGPTATPCNECDPCKDITAGVDIDVQEIDGASNNGVDDVRRLQESLPFRPARDRFKIVIVDEVHMLSTGAFNAFLKTLEEPPSHVKFIFATTESHKVPITIRSRCQRHDFRLIPQGVIGQSVRNVLAAEGVEADDEAVGIVAREAAGSMRDALTLLDQLVASCGKTLAGEQVTQQLGIAARDSLHGLARAVLEGDAKAVLELVEAATDRGADPLHFAQQLLRLIRDLVVLQTAGPDTELVDFVAEEREAAKGLVSGQEPLELQRAFAGVAKLVDEVAKASSPRMVLDMGLVRLATRPPLRALSELIERLERLEGGGSGGAGGAPGGGGRSSASGRGGGSTRSASAEGRAAAPRPSAPRETESPRGRGQAPGDDRGTGPSAPARPASARPPAVPPSPVAAEPAAPLHAAPAAVPDASPARVEPPAPQQVSVAPAAEPPAAKTDTLRRPAMQEWESFVDALREGKPALAAVLEHGIPRVVSPERIVLSFQEGSFYGRQADAPAAREAIAHVAEQRLGVRPPIEIRYDADGAQGRTVAAVEATRREARLSQRRREALGHPIVREAMQVFSESAGRVRVRLDGE